MIAGKFARTAQQLKNGPQGAGFVQPAFCFVRPSIYLFFIFSFFSANAPGADLADAAMVIAYAQLACGAADRSMRSVPKAFYSSAAWQACRASYLAAHPLCEDCLQRGAYTPAAHVHHMTWLTPDNWQDARISLNHDNLRALCIDCHNRRHAAGEQPRRWRVDERGRVVTTE